MEAYKSLLRALQILTASIMLIVIIVQIATSVVTDDGAVLGIIMLEIFGTLIQIMIWQITIVFVKETIKLRDDFEEYKKENAKNNSELKHAIYNNTYKIKENEAKILEASITTILPAKFQIDGSKRWVDVDGKFTYDKSFGVKCPQCSRISSASTHKCPTCKVDFYYKTIDV